VAKPAEKGVEVCGACGATDLTKGVLLHLKESSRALCRPCYKASPGAMQGVDADEWPCGCKTGKCAPWLFWLPCNQALLQPRCGVGRVIEGRGKAGMAGLAAGTPLAVLRTRSHRDAIDAEVA
jgi:hypothetical protein